MAKKLTTGFDQKENDGSPPGAEQDVTMAGWSARAVYCAHRVCVYQWCPGCFELLCSSCLADHNHAGGPAA